jgi:hypothetical protein
VSADFEDVDHAVAGIETSAARAASDVEQAAGANYSADARSVKAEGSTAEAGEAAGRPT